jgi:hypothetical protein
MCNCASENPDVYLLTMPHQFLLDLWTWWGERVTEPWRLCCTKEYRSLVRSAMQHQEVEILDSLLRCVKPPPFALKLKLIAPKIVRTLLANAAQMPWLSLALQGTLQTALHRNEPTVAGKPDLGPADLLDAGFVCDLMRIRLEYAKDPQMNAVAIFRFLQGKLGLSKILVLAAIAYRCPLATQWANQQYPHCRFTLKEALDALHSHNRWFTAKNYQNLLAPIGMRFAKHEIPLAIKGQAWPAPLLEALLAITRPGWDGFDLDALPSKLQSIVQNAGFPRDRQVSSSKRVKRVFT